MIGTIKNVIRRTAGKNVYYFGTITSDKAKVATFVPVIEESDSYLNQDTKKGYQRPGKKSRMNKFKRYLIDHPDRLIPPIILSARSNWKFDGSETYGSLTLTGQAAIIDGQHRMGGFVALFEQEEDNREIDFICFDKLNLEQEKTEFIVINNEQKGVPKALSTFLGGSEESDLAWKLNETKDSPLKGKIFRTQGDQFTYFALHSVAKNIDRTFSHGAFRDKLDYDEKLEALINYWSLIAKHNSAAWADMSKPKKQQIFKLAELTGQIAWSLVGPQVLMKGWAPESGTFNWDEIEKVVKFMSEDFDWDKEGDFRGLTGEVGGRRIATELETVLAHYS